MTAAKHARGKTIVVVDGKLSRANWKSMDDEWPSEISLSNKLIALFIQKIIVNTNRKKTKTKENEENGKVKTKMNRPCKFGKVREELSNDLGEDTHPSSFTDEDKAGPVK